jgi:hypothetical protein
LIFIEKKFADYVICVKKKVPARTSGHGQYLLFFSSFGLDGDILVDKALDFCLVCGGIGRVALGMTGALNEKQVFVGAASVIELMHHISGDEIVLCAVDKEHRHLCVADALDRVDLFEIVFCDMFIEEGIPFKRLVSLSYEEFKAIELKDIRSTGYVIDTLEASLWCIFNTTSYKDAVLKAVNLGDDTDTVGAITGGLAGIIYGYDTIPSEWLEVLAKKDDIIELADKLDSIMK